MVTRNLFALAGRGGKIDIWLTHEQDQVVRNTEPYRKKAKGSLSQADLTHLRAILDLAVKNGTEVKLIIIPRSNTRPV